MSDLLLSPPVAFVVYLLLAGLLLGAGRILAGPAKPSELKSSLYAGGEALPLGKGGPGYRPFFVISLFFAILHLGVLMLGSGAVTWMSGVYLIGLFMALLALILG